MRWVRSCFPALLTACFLHYSSVSGRRHRDDLTTWCIWTLIARLHSQMFNKSHRRSPKHQTTVNIYWGMRLCRDVTYITSIKSWPQKHCDIVDTSRKGQKLTVTFVADNPRDNLCVLPVFRITRRFNTRKYWRKSRYEYLLRPCKCIPNNRFIIQNVLPIRSLDL